MFGAATDAVAHSPAAGGLSQEFDVGAIWRIWSVAISEEEEREKGDGRDKAGVERRRAGRTGLSFMLEMKEHSG